MLLNEFRRRVISAKGLWADELPSILWAYHVTPHSATRETPFRLTCGVDAMILVEVGEPSFRQANFIEDVSNENQCVELDMLEEVRQKARIWNTAAQLKAAHKYNTRVKPRNLKPGDLVLRLCQGPRKNTQHGKLAAKWEGPFRIQYIVGNGAYKLETLDQKEIPRTWNSTHLKYYYA